MDSVRLESQNEKMTAADAQQAAPPGKCSRIMRKIFAHILGAEALLTDAPLSWVNYVLLAIVVAVAVAVTIVIRSTGIEVPTTTIVVGKPVDNKGCAPLATTDKNFINAASGSPFVAVTSANCVSCSGVNFTQMVLAPLTTEVDWVAGASVNALTANGGSALVAARAKIAAFASSSQCSSRVSALTNIAAQSIYTEGGNTFTVSLGMTVAGDFVRLQGSISDYEYSGVLSSVQILSQFELNGFNSLGPNLAANGASICSFFSNNLAILLPSGTLSAAFASSINVFPAMNTNVALLCTTVETESPTLVDALGSGVALAGLAAGILAVLFM